MPASYVQALNLVSHTSFVSADFWKGEDRHQLNAKTMGRNTKKLATRSLPSGKRINNQFETDGIHRCPELRAKEKSAPSDNKIANVLVI